MKYTKRSEIVEAMQWFKDGDHKAVKTFEDYDLGCCNVCSAVRYYHGLIQTPYGSLTVCPGDWIVTTAKGNYVSYHSDEFQTLYEKIGKVKKSKPINNTKENEENTKNETTFDLSKMLKDIKKRLLLLEFEIDLIETHGSKVFEIKRSNNKKCK